LSILNNSKQTFYKAFPSLSKRYHAYRRLVGNQESYLYQSGWMDSISSGSPVNADGQPIPWMNFSVIEFLEARISGDMTVFEYGSGYSTLFFAGLAQHVTSVEYDQGWLSVIGEQLPSNATVSFCEKDVDGSYCRSIQNSDTNFDVVIVDGRDRVNCLIQATTKISEMGVIILDDSHRDRYKVGHDYLVAREFKVLTISGLKPTGTVTDYTTVYYRKENCFNL